MAIAHLATEYVFSDFLLKEPTEPKFKGLRLELAVDKMVTCIAVGLPLLLISLAFAQEISIEGGLSGAFFSPSLLRSSEEAISCPCLVAFSLGLELVGPVAASADPLTDT
ncbi:Pannexin-1 [Microtus ochrogaster]|uniref:Pannexin-1 n=1 Tax=Microtus ochrogaster TaxID=79684 RepID=A0A8J6GC10_MICOH|nr:Pannexin-1 [Microtus ochrogaster]